MTNKPFAVYADRNGEPILEILRDEFSAVRKVLEIGSGTGQHAARFAAALPDLQWQTSDLAENHDGINAWVSSSNLDNLLPPLLLDVRTDELPIAAYDGLFSANTTHIMSFDSVKKMFKLIGTSLTDGGVFCLYGPFRQGGVFNSPSNASFHASLRSRDSDMGIRQLEKLDDLGRANGLIRKKLYAMPANNHIAVWRKEAS
jgi:SAM-dependent methyltransferase